MPGYSPRRGYKRFREELLRGKEVSKQPKNDGIASHSLAMTMEAEPVRLPQFKEGFG